MVRTSVVDNVNVANVSFASILQIGDSNRIKGTSRALAVQREAELFFGNEGSFNDYSVFIEPLPVPPITDRIEFKKQDDDPYIRVGCIDITGISSASLVHIGNASHISMEARIKHVRQLLSKEKPLQSGQ